MDNNHQSRVNEEISEISPLLGKIDKSNPYKVPRNYFSTLETDILQKVKEEVVIGNHQEWNLMEQIKTWLQQLTMPRLAMAMAGVLVLIVAGALVFNNDNSNAVVSIPADQEIFEYLEQNISDFDEGDFVEIMNPEDLEGFSLISDPDIDLQEFIELEDIDIESIL